MVQLRARIAFFRALNYLCAPTDNPHWLDEQKINFLWAKIYPPITQFSTPTDQEIERLRQWWFQWRDSTQEEMVRKLCQDEAE